MSQITDEELIARCASGDRCAMDVLVSRYHGKLLDFAVRELCDRELAADIAQKALIRAFESSATYKPKAKFKTWLYTIALNLMREEFRRRKSRKESLICEIEVENAPAEPSEGSAESVVIEQFAQSELWDEVCRLPEQQRTAVILRFRSGLSYDEISEVMGAPSGTVKSWVHYALKALRKSLEPAKCED